MGLLKKIFKPVSKVLDKVIPNEIKPAIPYLAALAPVFAPAGIQSLLGQTMMRRAITSGGLNILGQLSQEGSEGDVNLLSAGLGALTGAMTTPGTAPTTIRGDLTTTVPDFSAAGIAEGPALETIRLPGFGAERVVSAGQPSAAEFFRGLSKGAEGSGIMASGQRFLGDTLAKGSEMFAEGAAEGLLSKAEAKAATLPAAVATGDVMQAQARQLEKEEARQAALAEAEALADSGARADAIRNAMRAYGFFTDEEIEETISSAGYKAGGRVGFRFGGIDAAIDKVEDESLKESVKMVSDMPDMDLMDLIEEFEIIFKRKPISMEELKQFYRETYEMESPVKMKEKIREKITVEAKDGGLMDLGGKEMDLRGGGFVPIGKKERADDVPARLSKNEFVMTADAVRGAGGGDINKGAKRMYETMNSLEARA